MFGRVAAMGIPDPPLPEAAAAGVAAGVEPSSSGLAKIHCRGRETQRVSGNAIGDVVDVGGSV